MDCCGAGGDEGREGKGEFRILRPNPWMKLAKCFFVERGKVESFVEQGFDSEE